MVEDGEFNNLRVNNELKLQCSNVPELLNEDIVKKTYWFEDGKWAPDGLSHGDSRIFFRDGDTGPYLNLFEIISSTTNDALLATDVGLVVQKDIFAGGYLSSKQGALLLGSGFTSQVDVPKIILSNSDVSRLNGGGYLEIPEVPSGSGNFPTSDLKKGQVFIRTDQYQSNPPNTLYKYNGSSWDSMGPTSDFGGNFDTLHLVKFDGAPAGLNLGKLQFWGTTDPYTAIDFGYYRAIWCNDAYDYTFHSANAAGNGFIPRLTIRGHAAEGSAGIESHESINPAISGLGLGSGGNQWTGIVAIGHYLDHMYALNNVSPPAVDIAAHFNPADNNTWGLGSGTKKWAGIVAVTGYFDSLQVGAGGSNTLTASGHFNPLTNNNLALGSGGNRWLGIVATTGYFTHLASTEGSGQDIICDSIVLRPATQNVGNIGTNTYYWGAVFANYLLWHTSHYQFDALDDLALVKNYQTKTVTIDGVRREIIDDESLKFLQDENGFYTPNAVNGFLLGCIKALVKRLELLETKT